MWHIMDVQGQSGAKATRMPKATLANILRFVVVISLCSYLASRVYVAYTKLEEGKIGTLFNRITSAKVLVSFYVIQTYERSMLSCIRQDNNDLILHLN